MKNINITVDDVTEPNAQGSEAEGRNETVETIIEALNEYGREVNDEETDAEDIGYFDFCDLFNELSSYGYTPEAILRGLAMAVYNNCIFDGIICYTQTAN